MHNVIICAVNMLYFTLGHIIYYECSKTHMNIDYYQTPKSKPEQQKSQSIYPEKLSLKFVGAFYLLLAGTIALYAFGIRLTGLLDIALGLIIFCSWLIALIISIACIGTRNYKKTVFEYIALLLILLPVLLPFASIFLL